MAHLRAQIFDAIISRLSAISEFSAPEKIRRSRKEAIKQELLPALTVTWAEGAELANLRPCSGPNGEDGYDRILPMSIVVHLRDDDPEVDFDRLCVSIETVMGSLGSLGGLVIEALLETQRYYVNPQTGISLLAGTLNYRIYYKALAADPQQTAL